MGETYIHLKQNLSWKWLKMKSVSSFILFGRINNAFRCVSYFVRSVNKKIRRIFQKDVKDDKIEIRFLVVA